MRDDSYVQESLIHAFSYSSPKYSSNTGYAPGTSVGQRLGGVCQGSPNKASQGALDNSNEEQWRGVGKAGSC